MNKKVLSLINGSRYPYTTEIEAVKKMFLSQWCNGDLKTYMQNVKKRVKQMYEIDLNFSNEHEFFDELMKYKLVQIIEK